MNLRPIVLSVSVVALAACAAPPSKAPLPPDVRVEAPSDSLAPDVKAFSGKWTGRWINSLAQLDHTLVVEKIDATKATLIYSVGEPTTSNVNITPQWRRVTATVSPGKMEFTFPNGAAVVYKLQANGTLAGTYTSKGFNTTATLTRAPA